MFADEFDGTLVDVRCGFGRVLHDLNLQLINRAYVNPTQAVPLAQYKYVVI